MSALCHHDHSCDIDARNASYRRVLWVVLVINAVMFVVEGYAGWHAGSVALQADALDFFGDSASYAIALWAVGRPLKDRAYVAFAKGAFMGLFGLWIFGNVIWRYMAETVPSAYVMGTIGILAFVANAVSAFLLFKFRKGDSNMKAVWVCSRNDAIGNLGVIIAATGVFAFSTGLPDLIVGSLMGALALWGATQVIRHALEDIKKARK